MGGSSDVKNTGQKHHGSSMYDMHPKALQQHQAGIQGKDSGWGQPRALQQQQAGAQGKGGGWEQ